MGDVTQILAEKEVQRFDLENYSARMAHYLEAVRDGKQLFFRALNFAYQLHAGQRRKSGAPYISHPSAVAEILLRELRLVDAHLLAAAILHDIVEDVQDVTLSDIKRHFGEVVAELVDGCTKLTRYHLDRPTLKDLTHSKIFVSASRRLGVVIITGGACGFSRTLEQGPTGVQSLFIAATHRCGPMAAGPTDRPGPVKRKPVKDVVFLEKFGARWPFAEAQPDEGWQSRWL